MTILQTVRGIAARTPALVAAAFVAALGVSTHSAEAATMVSCRTPSKNAYATLGMVDVKAALCFSGNDTNQIDAKFSLFGKTGWVLSQKTDDGNGTQALSFATAPVNGAKKGSWAINGYRGLTDVAITLKAGNGFGAFLLNTTALSGLWQSSKDLSHASIYYNGTPEPVGGTLAPVPLPAAAWLLLGGLGGLGALAGRRKRAA